MSILKKNNKELNEFFFKMLIRFQIQLVMLMDALWINKCYLIIYIYIYYYKNSTYYKRDSLLSESTSYYIDSWGHCRII